MALPTARASSRTTGRSRPLPRRRSSASSSSTPRSAAPMSARAFGISGDPEAVPAMVHRTGLFDRRLQPLLYGARPRLPRPGVPVRHPADADAHSPARSRPLREDDEDAVPSPSARMSPASGIRAMAIGGGIGGLAGLALRPLQRASSSRSCSGPIETVPHLGDGHPRRRRQRRGRASSARFLVTVIYTGSRYVIGPPMISRIRSCRAMAQIAAGCRLTPDDRDRRTHHPGDPVPRRKGLLPGKATTP